MKTKIAIAGLPKSNKTLLANALSNMTGIPFIQNRTMYEWHTMYNLFDSCTLEWKDMFLIASSSFFERVGIEAYFDQFISDGASFSELIWLKSDFPKPCPSKMPGERNKLVECFENVSVSYAAQQYDFIVHAHFNDNPSLNNLYVQLYMKYDIPYKVYHTGIVEDALNEIANDLNLPVIHPAERSIYQAKINLFNYN